MAGPRRPRRVAQSGGRQGVLSEGQHSEGRPGRVQHQGQRLSIDCSRAVSGGRAGNPVLRDACRIRRDRCGDGVMDATVILIDSDAELARARALLDRLWSSSDPADVARLEAQARLIAAYEERKWPRQPASIADLIRHLMDQHGLTRADMVPILGTPSRVSEILRGKKGLSMAMVQRLRARFRVPADLLLPPPKKTPARRATTRAAA